MGSGKGQSKRVNTNKSANQSFAVGDRVKFVGELFPEMAGWEGTVKTTKRPGSNLLDIKWDNDPGQNSEGYHEEELKKIISRPSSVAPEHEFTRKENNDLILESRKLINSSAPNDEVNDYIWENRKQIVQMPEDQLLELFNDFRPYDLWKTDQGTADNLLRSLSLEYPNMPEWKEGHEFYERLRTADNGYELTGVRATLLRNWGGYRHPEHPNNGTKPEDHADHPSNTNDMWAGK